MPTRRPFALSLTVLALVTWILPVSAFAERIGSPYRGPIEMVGGGSQEAGAEPSPGGDTSGGDTSGNGGGSDGGAAPPPDAGGGGAAPGGPGGGGAGGAGGKQAKLDGKVVWQWWWEYSKERYLALASEHGRVNMGSSYYWFGGGAKFPPRDIVEPSEKQKASASFAQLSKLLHEDTSPGVRAEAAIALGRMGVVAATTEQKKKDEPDNLVVRELISAVEKDTIPEVRTSALIALGMTQDKDAAAYLLRGYDKHTAEDKPYVLVALGLSSVREEGVVKLLVDQLPKSGRARDGISVAAVHAIGLLGPGALAEVEKAGGVAKMTKALDGRGHDPLQTQLVRTLSLLQVGRKDVAQLVNAPSRNIQWMAILALANYAKDEKDAEAAFKTLEGKGAFDSGDSQNKSFAVIAMGRLAGDLDPNSKLRDKILKFVRKEALETKNNYIRSCAALAVGLAGDRSAIPTVAALLTDTTAQDHVVSAACVGLGLLKATDVADSIRDNVLLKKSWDDDTRGYAALGIALMGDTTRIDELKHFAADKSLNDKTKRQLPLALGLLGDKADVRTLVQFFARNWKKNERFEVSNAAFGLSWLKDQSAVEQLIALTSKSPDADVRGMAAIALGYVSAQDRVSPLSRCYENSNHRNGFGGFSLLVEISQIL